MPNRNSIFLFLFKFDLKIVLLKARSTRVSMALRGEKKWYTI